MSRHRDEDEDDSAALSHNPFGALASLRDQLPEGSAQKPAKARKAPRQVLVRLEQKGPEGKELTVVSGLGLKPKALENCLIDLKAELDCRGAIDEGVIYLQGDQREHLPAVLKARGISNVTVT